jgi:hypothetical protein
MPKFIGKYSPNHPNAIRVKGIRKQTRRRPWPKVANHEMNLFEGFSPDSKKRSPAISPTRTSLLPSRSSTRRSPRSVIL